MGNKTTETLTDKVNGQDEHMSRESGQRVEIFTFQKIYNPLTFYSRLVDLGFNKKCAMDLTITYEERVYEFINEELKNKCKDEKFVKL